MQSNGLESSKPELRLLTSARHSRHVAAVRLGPTGPVPAVEPARPARRCFALVSQTRWLYQDAPTVDIRRSLCFIVRVRNDNDRNYLCPSPLRLGTNVRLASLSWNRGRQILTNKEISKTRDCQSIAGFLF
jgi:hypothetical protein